MTTAFTRWPLATTQLEIAFTVPETEACTGADTKPPASPIT